eukprot:3371725-Pyramimonas_sp.AAC.1
MEWMADEGKAGGALPLPQVCCIKRRVSRVTPSSTGPSSQQSSSGVAVGARTSLGSTPTATT